MNPAHVTLWGWYWLAWIGMFLAPELYWVFVNSANTLSDQVWGLERMDLAHPLDFAEWTLLHWAIAIVVWLLLAWLSVHMPFGYLR